MSSVSGAPWPRIGSGTGRTEAAYRVRYATGLVEPREVAEPVEDFEPRPGDKLRASRSGLPRKRVLAAVNEERPAAVRRELELERPLVDVRFDRRPRLGRVSLRDLRVGWRLVRPRKVERPGQVERLVSACVAAVVLAEALVHPRAELGKPAVADGAKRAAGDEPRHAVRVRDPEVHRKVATPRVADHPRALDVERVEDSERVRHVAFDGRASQRTWLDTALLVSNRREVFRELGSQRFGVVREPRAAVENERRLARAVSLAAQDAALDGRFEALCHARTLAECPSCRRWKRGGVHWTIRSARSR